MTRDDLFKVGVPILHTSNLSLADLVPCPGSSLLRGRPLLVPCTLRPALFATAITHTDQRRHRFRPRYGNRKELPYSFHLRYQQPCQQYCSYCRRGPQEGWRIRP
jgi:hypothetical protein